MCKFSQKTTRIGLDFFPPEVNLPTKIYYNWHSDELWMWSNITYEILKIPLLNEEQTAALAHFNGGDDITGSVELTKDEAKYVWYEETPLSDPRLYQTSSTTFVDHRMDGGRFVLPENMNEEPHVIGRLSTGVYALLARKLGGYDVVVVESSERDESGLKRCEEMARIEQTHAPKIVFMHCDGNMTIVASLSSREEMYLFMFEYLPGEGALRSVAMVQPFPGENGFNFFGHGNSVMVMRQSARGMEGELRVFVVEGSSLKRVKPHPFALQHKALYTSPLLQHMAPIGVRGLYVVATVYRPDKKFAEKMNIMTLPNPLVSSVYRDAIQFRELIPVMSMHNEQCHGMISYKDRVEDFQPLPFGMFEFHPFSLFGEHNQRI